MPSRTPSTSRRLTPPLALAAALLAGCSWLPKPRPARPGEPLELPGLTLRAPEGPGWSVVRDQGDGQVDFLLLHQPPGPVSASHDLVLEAVSPSRITGDFLHQQLTAEAEWRARVRMPAAQTTVAEVPVASPARLGEGVQQVIVRADAPRAASRGAPADLAVGLGTKLAAVAVVRRAGEPVASLSAKTDGEAGPTQEAFLAAWQALLDGAQPRPPGDDGAAAVAAQADAFPKVLHAGQAARSLTLPQGGFQIGLRWDRAVAPGGFSRSTGLAIGVTDRLQLEAPGFLTWSFGESEALTRAEWSLGAGLSSLEHGAGLGNRWGAGLRGQVRRRFRPDAAARAEVLVEGRHASRTGAEDLQGGAAAGVVWDVAPWLSLSLEAGGASRLERAEGRGAAWIGGLRWPLLSLQLPLAEVGLAAAATWDGRRAGMLAGVSTKLTF